MKKIMISLGALTVAACSGEMKHGESGMSHAAHQMDEGIVISSARVLPPFPGRDTAAGYMSITNNSDVDDKLLSVTSPISGAVEIHNHIEENGVMKMRQVQGIELKAGETVELKPGSYHLMMFKANLPDGQEDVSLTLNYENAASVTMIVPVEGRGESSKMDDHSGH
ncbi:copper chaperone PCu(A)C [Hellea balneolensis]|uniref:copper chaperone PCu(A)C n=1 Tax=Hellea balneolensis TaxID=287478 RepID=UPI0004056FC7|nr:copper chaperone PCu(A)C [Hellea balneolensis]